MKISKLLAIVAIVGLSQALVAMDDMDINVAEVDLPADVSVPSVDMNMAEVNMPADVSAPVEQYGEIAITVLTPAERQAIDSMKAKLQARQDSVNKASMDVLTLATTLLAIKSDLATVQNMKASPERDDLIASIVQQGSTLYNNWITNNPKLSKNAFIKPTVDKAKSYVDSMQRVRNAYTATAQ